MTKSGSWILQLLKNQRWRANFKKSRKMLSQTAILQRKGNRKEQIQHTEYVHLERLKKNLFKRGFLIKRGTKNLLAYITPLLRGKVFIHCWELSLHKGCLPQCPSLLLSIIHKQNAVTITSSKVLDIVYFCSSMMQIAGNAPALRLLHQQHSCFNLYYLFHKQNNCWTHKDSFS